MKAKYFFWDTTEDLIKSVFEGLLAVGLLCAFWYYGLYAAFAVVMILLLILVTSLLHFIAVSDSVVREIKWFKVETSIQAESIVRVNTSAEKNITEICIYGETELIKFPYKEKVFRALSAMAGIETETYVRLTDDVSPDFEEKSGDYLVIKETVMLDELVGKRRFIHREIKDTREHIQAEESKEIDSESGEENGE